MAKMHGQGSKYYASLDNYYSEKGEQVGQWFGKTAERLGLEGSVDNKVFDTLVSGDVFGTQLGNHIDGDSKHTPGWDHTFNAPKSVSLLALVGGDKRLIAAHEQAVDEVLKYIEKNIVSTRKRSGDDVNLEKTGNLIAAKWLHDISRDKDAHLHTHATILNITFGSKDELRSIDSPIHYDHKMMLGAIYQSFLAQKVKELGYQIEISQDGTFEIKGISREVIEHNSNRRKTILETMKEQGVSGAIKASLITLLTRPDKEQLTKDERNEYWQETNKDFKQLYDDLISKSFNDKGKNIEEDSKQIIKSPKAAVDYAIKHLEENEAVMKPRDIMREAIVSSLGQVHYQKIEKEIIKRVESGKLLQAKMTLERNIITKTQREELGYITPRMLELENKVIDSMLEHKNSIQSISSNPTLSREEAFTKGQVNAAKMILTTKDRFVAVQGLAGTGKTFMLQEVLEQAHKQGIIVKGMSVSSTATKNLELETGIQSTTVQKHLVAGYKNINNEEQVNHHNKELWVVDEASFISTHQANALVQRAIKENARVVFLGDKQQKGAVEAGRPFSQMQNNEYQFSVATMDEIMRQKNKDLLQGVKYAYKGEVTQAMNILKNNIIEVKDKDDNDDPIKRREIIAKQYAHDVNRDNILVINPSNEGREFDNLAIREELKVGNVFMPAALDINKQVNTTKLVNANLTREQKSRVFNYQEGEVIKFVRKYDNKHLQTEKDSYHIITVIDRKNNTLTIQDEKGNTQTWDPLKVAGKAKYGMEVYKAKKFEINKGDMLMWRRGDSEAKRFTSEKIKVLDVENNTIKFSDIKTGEIHKMDVSQFKNQHLDYAYALTDYLAQGLTYDKVMINLESWRGRAIDQKGFYVDISRARHGATIYTDDKEQLEFMLTKNTGEKQSALEQTIDERIMNFNEQLKALHDAGKDVTLADLLISKDLQEQAQTEILSNRINEAVDIITKSDPEVNSMPYEFRQDLIDNAHNALKTVFGDNYKDVVNEINAVKNVNREIALSSAEIKQESDKFLLDLSIADITQNKDEAVFGKITQKQIDEAHQNIKEIIGKDGYNQLLSELNDKHNINLSSEQLQLFESDKQQFGKQLEKHTQQQELSR
jgi:conjugative relaxase-like TrwC/TraI family protein